MGSCIIAIKTHQNYICFFLSLGLYHPKNLYDKPSKICQFLRFGLHPYELATLRATIGLIITSCYGIKLSKIKGFVTSE